MFGQFNVTQSFYINYSIRYNKHLANYTFVQKVVSIINNPEANLRLN